MAYPRIVLKNESTVVTEKEAALIVWALQSQLYYHFAPAWKLWAHVEKSATVPSGSWVLALIDNSDQEGALGYHSEDGAEVPAAYVFCKTALEDGIEPAEVASHEVLEMLLDPHIYLTALDERHKRLYAVEACDACQGNSYKIGNIAVADFLLPNYFDSNTSAKAKTDFRGALSGPFSLGHEGYYSFIDLTNYAAGWQQKVGSDYKGALHDPDDRLAVRRDRSDTT